jgi:uncharacterized protein
MQKALITGATSGIGKELATIMAQAGHDLILVSRRINSLNEVKNEIESKHGVKVSVYASDLSKAGAAKTLYDSVKKENVRILVNNAGVGLRGNFFDDDLSRTLEMTQLNMISLMELTQLFGKDFIASNQGRILNIASIAAFYPGPKQTVYHATKSFVRSLSRALAYNLRHTNVTITTLYPGITKTNFFKSSNARAFNGGASAKSVAELGYKAMMDGKIEVTHGLSNKFLTNIFVRIIPNRYHASIIDRASEV